jgi:putative membrane-bound dehydrogenase-like protein
MTLARLASALTALVAVAFVLTQPAHAELPKVPDGFEVRLVATVPAVLYPCQVATAPDGSLFVAEDPMDQVGPYEAYHGRILLFREGKDPIVFADGLRAVFGMAWYEGSLYVSHMPFLTVLRDVDGDGKADERTDLFKDLGPTNNQGLNDHIVSGIQFGMDGLLYIAVGDKGVPQATGPDGRTVQLKGGGTLRCRPNGTGLEILSSGTRNHLEPNLDNRDNLFTYDNTDDGDGWWTRVTHHVDGGYYGYPYDYHDRADRMLPRIAEFGGGSPCGALVYKEDIWPEKYRGVGFWAEWGKGKVHAFHFAPDGGTFKIAEEIDFAVPDGLQHFNPIDLALSYDGRTMYVADWNMGGWGSKTEKVGRIFAITYKGEVATRPRGQDSDTIPDQIKQLDHPSFNERMRAQRALVRKGAEALGPVTTALADPQRDPIARRHLIWTLDGIAGATPEATLPIIELLKSDVPDLRAQAARALGIRQVPIAVDPLVGILKDPEPSVRLQGVIALGRIGDTHAVPDLLPRLVDSDPYVAFSARQAIRRVGDWDRAAEGLKSSDPKIRAAVLAALELQYQPEAANALAEYTLGADHPVEERAKALRYLAEVHRKAKPWDGQWWGTRPSQGQPPAKVDQWQGTSLVHATLVRALADPSAPLRIAAADGVQTSADRECLPALRERLTSDKDPSVRAEVALALGRMEDKEAIPLLVAALRNSNEPDSVQEAALRSIESLGTELGATALTELLSRADLPEERQVRVIAALGRFKAHSAAPAILEKVASPNRSIAVAAGEALGKIGVTEGVTPRLRTLLENANVEVRRAAIAALGALKDREAIPGLLAAVDDRDTRYDAGLALAAVPDIRALHVYLRGITHKNPDVRKVSAAALAAVRDQAAPVLDHLAERHELPPAAVAELVKIYTSLQPIASWRVLGPFPRDAKPPIDPERPIDLNATAQAFEDKPAHWVLVEQTDDKGRIDFDKVYENRENVFAFGYAEIQSPSDRKAQVVVGSDDTLTVWLNGKQVYDHQDDRGFEHEQERVDVSLIKGTNKILIKCANHGGGWMFAVAFTSSSDYAFLKAPATGAFDPERYREFAMKGEGKPERGKALFSDLKGLACVKCHRVSGEGGTVGPELTGVGAKYARDDLIASVLFPSAKIFSGYEPVVVATADGRVSTGIVKSETPEALEIEDADGKRIKIPKSDIDERKLSDVSLMPNGLAEGLTKEDFADVIAYLESLKEKAATSTGNR